MTGNTKYLRAAIRCADALVKNYRNGDESHTPWPVRCYARDGKFEETGPMSPYSANVIEPIMLFDELMRLKQGDVESYAKVRAGSWDWFQRYPLAKRVWVGYFEDATASMGNMNQVIPLEFARYALLHPDKDPQWRGHSRQLIEWVKATRKWPKYVVHGATVTTEQGNGTSFCCNLPNQCCDSHTLASLLSRPSTSQKPAMLRTAMRPFALTIGSLIFKVFLRPPRPSQRSGGLRISMPTVHVG